MKGIQGPSGNHSVKIDVEHASRRPGTAGHPGKHLGQFKKTQPKNDQANLPLIQQQLNAIGNSNVQNQNNTQTNTQTGKQTNSQQNSNSDLQYQIALDALRSTQSSISDQLSFTSRFNALTTVF